MKKLLIILTLITLQAQAQQPSTKVMEKTKPVYWIAGGVPLIVAAAVIATPPMVIVGMIGGTSVIVGLAILDHNKKSQPDSTSNRFFNRKSRKK